jgi:hypothetical protein
MIWPLRRAPYRAYRSLLHVDGFAVGIERAGNPDLLAFVLLQSVLAVDVVGLAAGILKNVLVPDFMIVPLKV